MVIQFTPKPVPNPSRLAALTTPPVLRLEGPEWGWIDGFVEHPDLSEPFVVTFSSVYPPFDDVWVWSAALACGLAPVSCAIDEESTNVWLAAEPLADNRLRLSLWRADGYQREAVESGVTWEEPRVDFVGRWSRAMYGFFNDDSLLWDQWHPGNSSTWPEPARDYPWHTLPAWYAPAQVPWPREALITWFWLWLAHHYAPRARAGWGDDAEWSFERVIAHATLRISAATQAYASANVEPHCAPPNCLRIAQEPGQDLYELGLQIPQAALASTRQLLADKLRQRLAIIEHASLSFISCTTRALWPHGRFVPGACFRDSTCRIGRVLATQLNGRIEYWSDGMIAFDHMQHVQHALRADLWPWPTTEGPIFDISQLSLIDARRYAFLRSQISPHGLICPVCGYPCMDSEWDDISSCDICGWPLWPILYRPEPALDATLNNEGDPITHTLRECRRCFLDHGDAWPIDHIEAPDDEVVVSELRKPVHQEATRACRAEWDAWLTHPDPGHTPDPVWLRVNRWERAHRKHGEDRSDG